MPSDHLKRTLPQLEAFTPSAVQLHAHFESLVCTTMTLQSKSPVASPHMELAPTARDRYVSLSSNAIGAYLTVARFWIPPGIGCGALLEPT